MSLSAGSRIRYWRELLGVTQTDLAERAGWDKSKLCKIEGGTQQVRARELELLVEALGLSWAQFYGEEIAS